MDDLDAALAAVAELRYVTKAQALMADLACPRCGGTDFILVDCGPDGYDDDISYTSDVCRACDLWHSGWTDRWLVDVETWQDEDDAEVYDPTNPAHAPR